jgi:PAS domain S-box-containing protein
MPQSEPVAILVVSEVAEEIKLVTLSIRGFFPSCRVEVAYSLEDALQWAPRIAWHLILLDERLLEQRTTPVVQELKRLAPDATVVLQTDRSDPTAALNTLQAGADFLLYKKSPAFLTELVLYARTALETRDIRLGFERTQERHARLIETLTDVFYELDAEGRFTFLGPPVAELLGYTPEELIGAPYSTIVPPDQLDRARHRFDDRRTGARATRRIELDLVRKAPHDTSVPSRVRVEMSAKGLYDAHRRYRGTVGLLHDLSRHRDQAETIQQLSRQLQAADRVVAMVQRLSTMSKNLRTPHAVMLAQVQQLLTALREVRVTEQVEALLRHAAEAVHLGEELAEAASESARLHDTINEVIDAVLAATRPPLLDTDRVERCYASDLPPFWRNRDLTMRLLRILLVHAQRHATIVGGPHRLRISTAAIGPTGARMETLPSLFPPAPPTEVEIHIEETAVAAEQEPIQETADLFEAYALIKQLGGRLDFRAPEDGLLSVKIWLPAGPLTGTLVSPPPASPLIPSATTTVEPPPPPSHIPAPAAPVAPTLPARLVPPLPDRRSNVRTSVHLPARITVGNVTRDGTITSLGPGGATVVIEGLFPPLDQQPAYVTLRTAAGILELQATVHERGTVSPEAAAEGRNSRLAFRFAPPSDIERKVLASLLEEVRARSLSLTVEALVSVPDQADDLTSEMARTDLRGTDHREAVRVRVALPVRVDSPSRHTAVDRPLSLVLNISRTGACLQMARAPGAVGDGVSLHFSAAGSPDRPRTHEPEAPEAIISGRIIWIVEDHRVPSELRPAPSQPGQRLGIRFIHLTPFAEREINRVVKQHIGSSTNLEGIASRSSIVSVRRECRNARDQVIALTDDHARYQISPSTPIVVIAPGFGQTQTDYLSLSFYLAANRLRVLRYDHTNHIGQSDGDVLQTTLRSMQVDLKNVVEFARSTWPTAPLTLLAEDVAARVALKTMAQGQAADRLLLLNPVLDVQTALSTTFRHDVITDYQHGLRRGVANLWGLNVNLDQFVSDTIAGGYADLATTTADHVVLDRPPIIFTSPKARRSAEDTFGPIDHALRTLGTAPIVVPLQTDVSGEAGDQDERHTAAFRTIFKLVAAAVDMDRPASQSREPTAQDIHRQQQLEQERIRIRHHVSQATRDALWVARLAQLPELANLPDYWAVEDELYRRILPLPSGIRVIDVGCGQGDLARVILTNQAYQSIHQSGPRLGPIHYVGLAQSHESLKMTDQYLSIFARELTSAFSGALSPAQLVETRWLQFDWDSPLPFIDRSIERILYHLSLPFTPSPLNCLREALRALHPEGVLVVTCFQPQADLAPFFRRHLHNTGRDEFGAPAQIVLHYLGRLREAIRHGVLHSYERYDLARLLNHAGARVIRITPVLDGQLLLAVAQKAKTAS